jgi:bacteriorhodopsin
MRNQRAATCHMPLSTANDLKHEAGCRSGFSYGQWSLVYNALSFGIAGMGCATIFFWLQLPNVTKNYRTALTITGLVTFIATYHYFRIFNSWNDAFDVKYSADEGDYVVKLTGEPFNDAYRYVDWILTVPLLLIELILVMGLPPKETVSKSWSLGLASAIMVALGYPGEIQDSPSGRWKFWFLAMIPFLYVVAELAVGLSDASAKQAPSVASLTGYARWLTIISWLTYPFVYIIKMLGISGVAATAGEQIGYSIADVVAKAVFGVLIWAIAAEKSKIEEKVMAGELIQSEAKVNNLREQLEQPLLA